MGEDKEPATWWEAQTPEFRRWFWVVVVGLVVVVGGTTILRALEDDPPTRRTPVVRDGDRLVACPDFLEVAGPYRRGIDPEYDPRMDWDGDGVSCE